MYGPFGRVIRGAGTCWVSQLAGFIALLDVSTVNVALASIKRGLNVSAATVQWVVSRYALALGLALVPAAGSATQSAGAGCS